MSWQTFVKEKDLGISVIDLSKLEENTRIDPEYYLPEYLIPYRKNLEYRPIGSILSKCQYGISKDMNELGIGTEIYRMNDLENGLCKDSNFKFVDIDEKIKKQYKLKRNDILFNRVNSIEFVGRTAIYKNKSEDRVFASYLVRINSDEDIILPDYLNIFLNCKNGKKELKRKARWAVNQANINAEELKRINLPIAPMSFQKEIEKTVNESYNLIEKSKSIYSEAQNILLKELDLINWTPSEKNISIRNLSECLIVDRFDAEYWQEKYDEIEHKIMSYKSGYGLLEDFIKDYSTGYPYKSESFCEEGIPLIRINNIVDSELDISDCAFIPKEDLNLSKKDIVKEFDILLSMSGTIGSACRIRESILACVNQRIMKITSQNFDPDVLVLILNSILSKMQLDRIGTGGVQTNISSNDIKKIKIPLLNEKIQKDISNKINESFKFRKESKNLLEKAKKAVEIFIEKDEKEAEKYLGK